MDIKEGLKTIRTEAEKKLGFPLVRAFWDTIEFDTGNAPSDFDGDPQAQEIYIEDYRNITERYVEVLEIVRSSIGAKRSTDGNREPTKPKKIYRKCFERRFYLVDFVVSRKLNSKTHRIDWKRTVMEWNEVNPSDTTSLPVLKAEYYHAIKDTPLMLQLIVRGMLEVAESHYEVYRDDNAWISINREKDFLSFIQSFSVFLNRNSKTIGSDKQTYNAIFHIFNRLQSTFKKINGRRQLEDERKQKKELKNERSYKKEG